MLRRTLLLTLLICSAAGPWAAGEEIVVASYNLENFVGPDAPPEAAGHRTAPKSEKAIAAVVRIVAGIAPDILGVCEMGSPEEFALLQQRLREAGLTYTDSEYVQAADPVRHLALLSRFPLVARQSEPNLTYELNGIPHKMNRGILDVTVQVNAGFSLRLVGVHLKSKLPVPEGEALIRRHEADLLHQHVEKILTATPSTRLLLYGDFNENRNEPPILEIAGPRGSASHLTELPAADDLGDRWTQYWKVADLYSRIDYFFASAALLHEIVPGKSRVDRSPHWNEASDHRAIYVSIDPAHRR
jgi:endonuclease/exonuclease/phosphatase family metal-dependent hydrolase